MKRATQPKRSPLPIALLLAVAAAAGVYWFLGAGSSAEAAALRNVSVNDLHQAAQQGALVLDVREPYEFAEGHVEGSLLVPLGTISARVGDFPKDEPVYVFCRSGNRSLQAAQMLVDAGYTDVRNVEGGIIAWNNARLPVAR
jgi:rhodanese-related sulfurtransferase